MITTTNTDTLGREGESRLPTARAPLNAGSIGYCAGSAKRRRGPGRGPSPAAAARGKQDRLPVVEESAEAKPRRGKGEPGAAARGVRRREQSAPGRMRKQAWAGLGFLGQALVGL